MTVRGYRRRAIGDELRATVGRRVEEAMRASGACTARISWFAHGSWPLPVACSLLPRGACR
jgi:hypothetical protein